MKLSAPQDLDLTRTERYTTCVRLEHVALAGKHLAFITPIGRWGNDKQRIRHPTDAALLRRHFNGSSQRRCSNLHSSHGNESTQTRVCRSLTMHTTTDPSGLQPNLLFWQDRTCLFSLRIGVPAELSLVGHFASAIPTYAYPMKQIRRRRPQLSGEGFATHSGRLLTILRRVQSVGLHRKPIMPKGF